MANVYTAVALDATSQERLLGAVTIPEGWKTYGEHMTIELKPLAKSMAAELDGQTKSLTVVALGISEAAIAVEVTTDAPSKNTRKHITVAVAPGCKPRQSNDILNWDRTHDIVGMPLEGVVREMETPAPAAEVK
jgi:hypothetical protein